MKTCHNIGLHKLALNLAHQNSFLSSN